MQVPGTLATKFHLLRNVYQRRILAFFKFQRITQKVLGFIQRRRPFDSISMRRSLSHRKRKAHPTDRRAKQLVRTEAGTEPEISNTHTKSSTPSPW